MKYFGELTAHWRPLTATVIGLGAGYGFTNYTASIMGPHLIGEFGWTRSEFAFVNSLALVLIVVFPLIGRLTDTVGVRRTALIGVIALPATNIALSAMTGDIRVYMALFLVQAIFCATTTSTVYVRIVIQYIERARGLGLAIVASMPALSLAILGPLLNEFVEANGWREGYLALAIFTGALGATALLMMPSERKDAALAIAPGWLSARRDYAGILKNKAFWIMFAAVAFCNLPQVLGLSQLNLMLLENGVPTSEASVMISSFSAGMFIGRFLCGLALDRFPSHIVAAVTMSLPSIGLFLIASDLDAPVLLGLSVFLIGLSYGGEGDIVAYLVARNFGVRIFSSVQGLMTGVISGSIALGAALLSFTLGLTDSFAPFLTVCGAVVLAGGLLFLLLKGSEPHVEQARVKAPATAAPAAD